ncbi:hypothetical protein GF354_06490 [Candidatus Peregrinibacteria bacterium]|nr:hypothetical protein [Candidatus Peregrinibacteria bacterium]
MLNFNLIEKLKITFGGRKSNKSIEQKRVGVIDEGVDATYINCEGIGPDGGLISMGKRMKSINSKWRATGEK